MASEWINDANLNEVEDEDIDIEETKVDETLASDPTDVDTVTTTANTDITTNKSSANVNSSEDPEVTNFLSNFGNLEDLISFDPLETSNDNNIKNNNNNKNQLNTNIDSKNDEDDDIKTFLNKSNNNELKEVKNVKFEALSGKESGDRSYRAIRVPGPRMIHIRRLWKQICDPIVSQLKLQIRMNSKKNLIEIRTSQYTKVNNAIQKGSDFIKACVLGFEIKDSIALIRMDDIYLESFDIRDVKFFNKKSDHWLRAVGRIAGQYGKIKYSIENSTNTRIVIFGFKVHILGSFTSIRLARNAVSRLVMGSSPGNVYSKLRVVSNRMKNRF